jgi:hypothetical protein
MVDAITSISLLIARGNHGNRPDPVASQRANMSAIVPTLISPFWT